jgi:hypothetical protein
MTRLLAALVGLALAAATASADCLDGTYLVAGDPLLSSPGGAFVRDAITVADGTVAIASGCPTVTARIRTTPRGKVIRAAWRQCGSLARFARLRAVVNKPCRVMKGLFRSARPPVVRRFVARNDACGAGRLACRPCTEDSDCRSDSFCAKPDGRCDGAGTCAPRPLDCPLSIVAVCGCDGTTYAGPCEAAQHGASVAHVGACTAVCGGIAGVGCPAGRYCELPAGECRGADLQGTCEVIPAACPDLVAPVCGCDDVTYGNDCERRAKQVQEDHDGACGGVACAGVCDCYLGAKFQHPCPLACAQCGNFWTCDGGSCVEHCGVLPYPPPPCRAPSCGTLAGIQCSDHQFCELPPDTCQIVDLGGTCIDIPQACPQIYAPVCGCDGHTYGNDCERQAAKVQKAHDGPCNQHLGATP